MTPHKTSNAGSGFALRAPRSAISTTSNGTEMAMMMHNPKRHFSTSMEAFRRTACIGVFVSACSKDEGHLL